jgi:hypothetical protein
LLKKSSLGPVVARYLRQLRDLERNRPSPLGGQCRFQAVRHYREAVMRLSLAMSAAAVADSQCLEEAIEATYHHELGYLFRMAMQCQIIDDVLDFRRDLSLGLPTFLTACRSLPQAFEQSRALAMGYASDLDRLGNGEDFALRCALCLLSACARCLIALHSPTRNSQGEMISWR